MWLHQASLQGTQAGQQHMAVEDRSMEPAYREGQVPMVGHSMEVASSMHSSSSSHLQAGMEVVVVVVVFSSQGPQEQLMASSSSSSSSQSPPSINRLRLVGLDAMS
jgi:hypothetical protein